MYIFARDTRAYTLCKGIVAYRLPYVRYECILMLTSLIVTAAFVLQDSWMFDYSFCLQYHLTLMGGIDKDSDLLLPNFGKMAMVEKDEDLDSRVSKLWSSCFQELVDLYESYYEEIFNQQEDIALETVISPINKNLTSHHGKKAANMAMADSSSAGLPQIFRTGWEVRTIHTLFDYVVGTSKMSRIATKNQNGWHFQGPDGNIIGGYPPEIKDINIDGEKIRPFMKSLYGEGQKGVKIEVIELCFASLLRFYDKFVDDLKKEPRGLYVDPLIHPYVACVQRARMLNGVSEDTFDCWKKCVHDGFVRRNRPALPINYSPSMEECLMDPRTFLSSYNALATSNAAMYGMFPCFVQRPNNICTNQQCHN
jgi:hypothetical protein